MSGTFWTPLPNRCKRPSTNIIHFHGDDDQTVPLDGRVARGKQQGSITDAFNLYIRHGRFTRQGWTRVGDMGCDVFGNRTGNLLTFCLYPGGHSFRSANLGIAWQMLRDAGQL